MNVVTKKIWRDYDLAALNVQYNSRGTVADFASYLQRYAQLTRAAKASLPCSQNLSYGDQGIERLDVYPAPKADAPVLVFLHGGDWRSLSKEDSGFAAPAFVAAGACFVVPDFTLLPDTRIEAMGAQLARMLTWVWRHITAYGGNPAQIFIAGHSSGANLVGQLLTTDWQNMADIPADIIKGAVFISGLGDLEPVRLSFRNENLGLDRAAVIEASLLHRRPTAACPLLVAVGAGETDDYKRQSREVAAYWRAQGSRAEFFELANRHHFDSVLDWGDLQSGLFRATLAMMNLK